MKKSVIVVDIAVSIFTIIVLFCGSSISSVKCVYLICIWIATLTANLIFIYKKRMPSFVSTFVITSAIGFTYATHQTELNWWVLVSLAFGILIGSLVYGIRHYATENIKKCMDILAVACGIVLSISMYGYAIYVNSAFAIQKSGQCVSCEIDSVYPSATGRLLGNEYTLNAVSDETVYSVYISKKQYESLKQADEVYIEIFDGALGITTYRYVGQG